MKILPFLIIGAGALLFMGLAGKTYRHTMPTINRLHADAVQRAENVERGFDGPGYLKEVEARGQ